MHVINCRNVREALPLGLIHLSEHGQVEKSRAGDVVVAPTPVATVYSHSQEMVLLSPVRDANPFFALAEGCWMLAGRRDGKFLDEYVRDFSSRFAEPDGVVHGAYGRRWRRTFGYDQLDAVVDKLRINPGDRQAVITMWDPTLPHEGRYAQDRVSTREEFGEGDLLGVVRDRPCNTHIYLRVREIEEDVYIGNAIAGENPVDTLTKNVLDIFVSCRSNDMIMGGYGANAVQFGVLHAYLACRIGVRIGTYTQMSFNYHIYLSDVRRMVRKIDPRLERAEPQIMLDMLARGVTDDGSSPANTALFTSPNVLDDEIRALVNCVDNLHSWKNETGVNARAPTSLKNAQLHDTVWRALWSHRLWRLGARDVALEAARQIEAPDWRRACVEWMQRRIK
jgi:Thymidylate synthase